MQESGGKVAGVRGGWHEWGGGGGRGRVRGELCVVGGVLCGGTGATGIDTISLHDARAIVKT